jgi:hypothetical protein
LGAVSWQDVAGDELVLRLPGLPSGRPLSGDAIGRLQPHLAEALARRRGGLPPDDPIVAAHAVACLEHGLVTLEGGQEAQHWAAGIFAAVCLSWETGINASYVQPETELLHETLSAAAWLGVVARGRDALLPPSVAEVIDRLLAGATAEESDSFSLASAYLRFRIDQGALGRPLRDAIAELRARAVPPLVRGARAPSPAAAPPPALARAMDRALRDRQAAHAAFPSRERA